jgi:hypothetical protein
MTDLMQRASEFATRTHQHIDQRRKYSGQPQDVHLAAMVRMWLFGALTLSEMGMLQLIERHSPGDS